MCQTRPWCGESCWWSILTSGMKESLLRTEFFREWFVFYGSWKKTRQKHVNIAANCVAVASFYWLFVTASWKLELCNKPILLKAFTIVDTYHWINVQLIMCLQEFQWWTFKCVLFSYQTRNITSANFSGERLALSLPKFNITQNVVVLCVWFRMPMSVMSVLKYCRVTLVQPLQK